MDVFLSGAEMQPERVRAAWPEARFVARARLEPRPVGAAMPAADARYATWGIVVDVPDNGVAGEARGAVTDDGRSLTTLVPPPEDRDPTAVLAAARYWELPPPYVGRLARAAKAPVEEPPE
jgi:hypothetical protein